MPRICAASVAEHRAAQERAILDAALALLTERPDVEPSFGEVAARSGLARSSIYTYFASRDELLLAVARDLMPRWREQIDAAVSAQTGPRAQVLAYADANLALIAGGEHAIIDALAKFSPVVFADPVVAAMHDELVEPLHGALEAMEVNDPAVTVELINAVVHKAGGLIVAGADATVVRESVRALLS